MFAVAGHPFTGAGPGDAHLGGDMGQRTGLAPLDETAATFDGQRGVTVEHGRVLSVALGELVVLPILPSEGPSAFFNPLSWCLQRHDPQQLTRLFSSR